MSIQSIKVNNLKDSNLETEKHLEIFLEDFTNAISSKDFAQIKEASLITVQESNMKEIDVLVKRKHLFQVIYWIKNNLLVRSIDAKRKSYITTLNVILNDGDSLKINLI